MMDNGYEILTNCNTSDSCKVLIVDTSECFICREAEGSGRDALRHFCDCKTLVAHHRCLLTWIKKGPGTEGHPRCSVCKAEYHLQKGSAWKFIACQWQTWLVGTATLALLALVPFVVFRMMTAFRNPPPHSLFKAAAICFGLLTEILLIKFLVSYCGTRYSTAKMSSFSVQARTVERTDTGFGLWWPAAAGQNSSTAVASRAGERKQEAVKASESRGLKL
ncbi:uncharacterized protein LOC136714540 [Amia ocellicauda]|uniref:uncharacterized protein LOC136714540 n=1 Tax=Amia ocellicauda TaxID=2972642 RepID=UPI003464DB9C